MGCAPSAASNQGPDAEAGEKAGHRPLVSENPGDAARKEPADGARAGAARRESSITRGRAAARRRATTGPGVFGERSAMQSSEYRSVRSWSKAINGTLTEGRKK